MPPSPRRIPGEGPPVEVPMQSVMFAEAPGGMRKSLYFRGGNLFSWGVCALLLFPPVDLAPGVRTSVADLVNGRLVGPDVVMGLDGGRPSASQHPPGQLTSHNPPK